MSVQTKTMPITKAEKTLRYMLQHDELTAFKAFTELQDTCLNTTISDMKRNYGFIADRRTNLKPNKDGVVKPYKYYWIGKGDRDKAQKLVERLASLRGIKAPEIS